MNCWVKCKSLLGYSFHMSGIPMNIPRRFSTHEIIILNICTLSAKNMGNFFIVWLAEFLTLSMIFAGQVTILAVCRMTYVGPEKKCLVLKTKTTVIRVFKVEKNFRHLYFSCFIIFYNKTKNGLLQNMPVMWKNILLKKTGSILSYI